MKKSQETRIVLTAEDFKALVSGKEVYKKEDNTRMILQDIGWFLMHELIDNAEKKAKIDREIRVTGQKCDPEDAILNLFPELEEARKINAYNEAVSIGCGFFMWPLKIIWILMNVLTFILSLPFYTIGYFLLKIKHEEK